MKPYLWIAYDFTCTSECLSMLDTIVKQHPNREIIHEIGRLTLLQAALEKVPIISEFRQRLDTACCSKQRCRSLPPNRLLRQKIVFSTIEHLW